jgi:NADPH2:quinone reductase
MQAIYIKKFGKPETAFEFRDITPRSPQPHEIAIRTEASGINFADVVARLGNYRDCPPLPAVVGYEAVGTIAEVGSAVRGFEVGDRVLVFTRFGGYSQWIVQDSTATVKIGDMDAGKALALATQYSTAFFGACCLTNVLPNDKVLIHSGAGGVGTALIQLCKWKGAKIYSTCGSDAKMEYLRKQGVDYPVNYVKEDFSKAISEKMDIIFDAVGGENFSKSYKMLNYGGRLVGYGAASMTDTTNFLSKGKAILNFGIYHPGMLMMECKSILGINMLRIADHRPDILQYCLNELVKLYNDNIISPHVGKMYPVKDIYTAHSDLENRKTTGKIGLIW